MLQYPVCIGTRQNARHLQDTLHVACLNEDIRNHVLQLYLVFSLVAAAEVMLLLVAAVAAIAMVPAAASVTATAVLAAVVTGAATLPAIATVTAGDAANVGLARTTQTAVTSYQLLQTVMRSSVHTQP